MDWQKKPVYLAVSGFLSVCLVGCAGAPSSGEIEESLQISVDQGNQQARTFAGALFSESMLNQLHGAKKIGCVESRASMGYDCDVELDMTTAIIGRTKTIVPLRFVETDDGWRVMQ